MIYNSKKKEEEETFSKTKTFNFGLKDELIKPSRPKKREYFFLHF